MRKNVIFNDLTEDMVIKWRETGNPPVKDGLCSINENDAKELINLQKKRAKLSIVDTEGNILEEEVPVYYSMNTGYHYIYTETVQRLKVKGIILCKLYSYNNLMELNGSFENLNTESIIHQYGYNVSAIENLTSEQRRCILYGIITNRIATVEDIKNHLSFLIRVKKNVPKMTVACSKWKEDFEFLDKMEIDKYDEVIPTELIMKSVVIYD